MRPAGPMLRQAAAACARGDWAAAERICRKLLRERPRHFEALNILGFIAAQTGRLTEAAEWLGRAVGANPTDVAAQSNLGFVLQELGRMDEALTHHDAALKLDPLHAGAHNNRGLVLRALSRMDEALASCDSAIAIDPSLAEAHNNRGTVLQELRRLDEALPCYRRAVELNPDFARAHNNIGTVLQQLGRPEEALPFYERATLLDPAFAEAHNNRGSLLRELMRTEAAIACFDRAIAANPDSADAHWNKSLALLSLGDYARGFAMYEWRWKQGRAKSAGRPGPQPLWLGAESIAGKTILLYAEQGIGDTIQFCRYAKPVADLGARVILLVPESLLTLLASLDGVAQLVKPGDLLPRFDFQCPLMSLPFAFRTELATVPAPRAYLRPDPERMRRWKERLGERRRPRVGLVWSGGFRPDQPELLAIHARRNVDASLLAPLKDAGAQFYSLQKGEPAASDLARLQAAHWNGPEIIDWTDELHDFSETAALAANLDLVISVDTSTAHLVGALGKPIWILNRFDSCWRWLRGRVDSPWYPTARIYTQQRPGDWAGVLEKVTADLVRFVDGSDPASA
jgi:tetratricopeptide (TPR) repeat protein